MKKHRLEDRLLLMRPVSDGVGKYIPYCQYERHPGVIIHNKHRRCEKRECNHYLRLYLTYKEQPKTI